MPNIGRTGKHALGAFVCVAVLAAAGAAFAASPQSAPPKDLDPSYKTVPEWGAELPGGRKWGSASAIEADIDGVHIWVMDRCGANSCVGSTVDPIFKIDPAGKVVAHFGGGMMAQPHGITVDKSGNVWVTDDRFDEATHKGAQVFKFSPQGKLLMTLGKAGVSAEGPDTFVAPTDVIVAPNGNIFVSDGHVGSKPVGRIVVFSPEGKFIKQFGKYGKEPGDLIDVHCLAFDSKGRLFAADRENSRIQIFDQDGKLLAVWKQFGRPSGFVIDKNDMLYVTDSESTDKQVRGYNPGFKPMLWVGSAATGEVTGTLVVPTQEARDGGLLEGITIDAAGNLYTAEVFPKGLTGAHKHAKR